MAYEGSGGYGTLPFANELAMAEEIAALEHTGTCDLVPTPSHVRPIICKWVYKVKTRSDGSLERYKACLVAHGFQKEHGRDYDETFAPVAHMTTVCALLAVASIHEWSISQLVVNAFLNGELREEPPPGYSVLEGMVCRLRRSLYCLKQAPRAWFQRFAFVVTAAGFSVSAHDPALFVHTSSRGRTLLLLYVDDMIIIGDDPQFIAFVKARLSEQFLMSDLGPLRYFLGIESLLNRASVTDYRTDETPMELNVHLSATDVLFILVLLVLTFSILLFLLLLSSTIVTFFVSYVIFMGLCHVICSFHALALYSFRLIVMLLGLMISLIVDLFLLIVFFLVILLLLGRLRNRQQFLVVFVSPPTPLLTHGTGAISIARDPVKHELTKYIGIDAYYTCTGSR
ncbi:hypothetical protein U9M48_022171 [Paspalum notatum var. saurae]|uniref:Reverse transcriptase Ty1/copia-type domain-containing protein n=1 Tax=Paspalum notatum var. saurae TaxID=547442 RepID=A0AAQ3TI53_PASNO